MIVCDTDGLQHCSIFCLPLYVVDCKRQTFLYIPCSFGIAVLINFLQRSFLHATQCHHIIHTVNCDTEWQWILLPFTVLFTYCNIKKTKYCTVYLESRNNVLHVLQSSIQHRISDSQIPAPLYKLQKVQDRIEFVLDSTWLHVHLTDNSNIVSFMKYNISFSAKWTNPASFSRHKPVVLACHNVFTIENKQFQTR